MSRAYSNSSTCLLCMPRFCTRISVHWTFVCQILPNEKKSAYTKSAYTITGMDKTGKKEYQKKTAHQNSKHPHLYRASTIHTVIGPASPKGHQETATATTTSTSETNRLPFSSPPSSPGPHPARPPTCRFASETQIRRSTRTRNQR